jgi:site-specific DNA recombinase
VWRKIVQLMSSPELMQKQAARWFEKQRNKSEDTSIDFRAVEKEIAKLRNEEDRYNKAYGAGMFTIDQLKDYTVPVRDKIASLQTQMAMAAARRVPEVALPNQQQIEAFAQKATVILKGLKFMARQAIVRSVIEKGIVSQGELTITGRIPVETNQANSNVTLCSIHRHCGSAERRKINAF